jgi:hypothetical protein
MLLCEIGRFDSRFLSAMRVDPVCSMSKNLADIESRKVRWWPS